MKKFAIHIHLFLTSRDTELVAHNNLKKLKKSGFTIIVTSPKPLPLDFYEIVDFFVFDKENQLFQRTYENIKPITHWWSNSLFDLSFVIQKIQPHGLAVLRSMIKGCEIAKMLGFEYIIRFEYDDVFGRQSIKNLHAKINEVIENNYDFYLYKNDYFEVEERSDISVHLMFYKCESFLSVFQKIKNEEDYNVALESFGMPRKAILIEEFLWRSLKNTDHNIHYRRGENQFLDFSDTVFNARQIDLNSKNGLLCDVMVVKDGEKYRKTDLGVCVSNNSCDEEVDVYFDAFDKDVNLVTSVKISVFYMNQMNYMLIHNCENISYIKIRHGEDGEYYKTVYVYMEGDQVMIKDPSIVGYQNISELTIR